MMNKDCQRAETSAWKTLKQLKKQPSFFLSSPFFSPSKQSGGGILQRSDFFLSL
jgi:hypothetical protein